MRTALSRVVGLAVLAAAPAAQAQQQTAAAPALTPVQREILGQFDFAVNRVAQLAEAIPEDKYAWRPSEGVRSIGEVVAHVAAGNYYTLTMAGVTWPACVPQDMEKSVTAKADLIRALRQSAEHVRQATRAMTAADLDKPATLFGRATTNRDVVLAAAVLRNGYISNASPANRQTMAVNLTSERVRLGLSLLEGIRGGQSLGALLGYQFERGLHDRHGLAEHAAERSGDVDRRRLPADGPLGAHRHDGRRHHAAAVPR